MLTANFRSFARPYALAAFEYAHEKALLPEWQAFLKAAAYAVTQPAVESFLTNPNVSTQHILDLLESVLASLLQPAQKNFLRLLVQHHRIGALPLIADLFDTYFAALQKTSSVKVVTAVMVDDEYKQKLTQTLKKRFHQEVILDCEIDPAILGGAVIYLGDRVIDGSVRGNLARLLEFSLR